MKNLTKIQAMKELEKLGLSFTANVIMTGCSKPTYKMNKILKLIRNGHDVRHAQFETCAIVVDGNQISFYELDNMSVDNIRNTA